jgi:hypothetical protein
VSKGRIAALDTNVLLLKLVADTDVSLLRSFKRVDRFTERHIRALAETLSPFGSLVTTPHVLSETSNFIDQSPPYRRGALVESLQEFIEGNEEWYETARALSAQTQFTSLGLTDTGLLAVSTRATIVTVDWRLAGQIEAAGGGVINFNHLL